MKYLIIFILTSCVFISSTTAQKDSTFQTEIKRNSLLKKSILPLAIIITGVSLNSGSIEHQLKIDVRNKVGNDFEFKIDDYIQYTPIIEMYGADLLGFEAKNHWFDQTKYLAISQLTTAIIVHSLKRGINKTRPNGADYSFPSGHTSQAFSGATVLFHEFKETNSLLAYSGFAFATTTGAFRIINNAHWLSDVMVGAGISILVTNFVYHIEPLKNFNPFKKDKSTSLVPFFHQNEFGLYFTKSF